ncbi:MAG: nucleotidyltransferase family protein [Chloroflexi bacterium]|nr:MAG: nucleotidyltransferase family protein [Chloroflexota bacterium]
MILAAGEGRRLRPLTLHMPKPMLPVAGKPLLEHIIIHLRKCGITELAINLHHLPDAVTSYFGDGSAWGVSLRYSIEEQLLGSAGGVKRLESFFDDTFVVYYGDLLTWADLRPLVTYHRVMGGIATMGLYRVPDPWNRGIVDLDPQGWITRFVEKPPRHEVFSDLANAGIYVLEPDVLADIPADTPYDFGHDVFPALLANGQRVAGYVIEDLLIDIGLPDKYAEANRVAAQMPHSAPPATF